MRKCVKACKIVFFLLAVVLPVFAVSSTEKSKDIADAAEAKVLFPGNNDLVIRRAAFRWLIDDPENARLTILSGLRDADRVIRKRSIFEFYIRNGVQALPELLTLARDPDPQVMDMLLSCSKDLKEKHHSTLLLSAIAKESVLDSVRHQADKMINFTFHRDNKRLKDNPAFDHDLISIRLFQLPMEGWRFSADAAADGHTRGYFKKEFDDSKWKMLKIGTWEDQGFDSYDGIGWYRLSFDMPDEKACEAVELAFEAVDESAWVWLNGIYIGQHDIGPSGWDKPFWLDVTREIEWGKQNVLVVRVEDTAHAGGIWRPVSVELLK